MSIFPATDLVVDVAQAADPQRLNAAVTRLAEMSSTRARPNADFGDLVASVSGGTKPSARAALANGADMGVVARVETRALDSIQTAKSTSKDAIEKFEAYVVQTCLETILPKEQSIFGHGTAGGVWRSMIAEQIGAQIAKAGGVGLQRTLEGQWGRREADAASDAT